MHIRSLGYAWIESSNPQNWLEYGTQVLGLMPAPGMPQDGAVYLKQDERPFRFAIVKGDSDRLAALGWEATGKEAYEAIKKSLQQHSTPFSQGTSEEAALRCVTEFIRLDDPSGNTLEIYHGGKLDYLQFVSPKGVSDFETGSLGSMGFGHAVLPAAKLAETHDFYADVIGGFSDSDYMHFKFSEDPADPGQGLHFMHCNNPRHHSLGLYEIENPVKCIHLMVEVRTIDEVGYCLDEVKRREIPIVSTLGRHTNDKMLSFYMATPSGFAMEYGCQGLQMDWSTFTPTVTTLPSLWGHEFAPPPES